MTGAVIDHRRVLLVTPTFHGYWGAIQRALERRGHEVVVHRYDELPTFASKLDHKVRHELVDRVRPGFGSDAQGRAMTETARRILREVRPEVVVAIKADRIGSAFWDDVDDLGIVRILWLYDELRRTAEVPEDLRRFPKVVSYSPGDVRDLVAIGVDAEYLPTGFDADVRAHPARTGAVVFVGARYPNREAQLVALHRAGVAVRAYGRDWSHHPVDRLRTWSWHRPEVPNERDVPLQRAYDLVAGSVAAVNIHADQDGFTLRTFEAPGVGALQLIDRPDVDTLYEPGVEVMTYTSVDELVDLCQRSHRDPIWRAAIGRAGQKRTLAEHTFDHRVERLAALWA